MAWGVPSRERRVLKAGHSSIAVTLPKPWAEAMNLRPGDLIVFGDQHVGIVKEVLPDGRIQTIEGNYENKVALNVRTATEATGYVEMN